ncbi:MAG: hypothetical protein K2N20_01515, partial [Helicobacter sp.]|nr:hypothetical protein [Helicobacter sp.]
HRLWLGIGYALLRAPFCAPAPVRSHSEHIEQILLTFGASELAKRCFEIVESLVHKALRDVRQNVWIVKIDPANNPSGDEIRELMESSCLAISAAGGTLAELAFCGTPTIACCIADNQRPNFLAWAQSGAIVACEGEVGGAEFAQNLANAFMRMRPKSEREALGACAQNLVCQSLWQHVRF